MLTLCILLSYDLLADDVMPPENGMLNDSLATKTQIDSLEILQAEDISEETETDSLLDFRRELKSSLDKIALNENLEIPLDFFYREDFHLKPLMNEIIISRSIILQLSIHYAPTYFSYNLIYHFIVRINWANTSSCRIPATIW